MFIWQLSLCLSQRGLQWLTEGCRAGDVLLFFFSGCSARLPDIERSGVGVRLSIDDGNHTMATFCVLCCCCETQEDALVPSDFLSSSLNPVDLDEPRLVYSDEVHDVLQEHLKAGMSI